MIFEDMTLADWLIIIGMFLLLIGLFMAFISSRLVADVMGEASKGVAVLSPILGSAEDRKKDRVLKQSKGAFYGGLVLTALGVILQTIGALLAGHPDGTATILRMIGLN